MKHMSCLSAAVALLFCSSAGAAEWFVSPTGSDSAAGTEAAPFRTINYAIGQASAEDTIVLLPGDHVEGVTLLHKQVNPQRRSETSALWRCRCDCGATL